MEKFDAYKVAREYFPGMPKRYIWFVLWECTAFPFCGEEYLRGQLQEELDRLMLYRRKPSPAVVARTFQ